MLLENELVKINIDRNGSICGIYDKRIDRQYIKEKKFLNLFRIMIPNETWDGRYADSCTARVPTVTSDGSGLQLSYDRLVSADGKKTGHKDNCHNEIGGRSTKAYLPGK